MTRLTPDGRIQSRNIGSGEVNSRVINDLRSDNYDGSQTDPVNIGAGTAGWQILKSGLAVFNEVIVRGTIQAAEILSAKITSGRIHVGGSGAFTAGADPENPTTTLNASGVEVGPTTLDSSGLQVGSGVVIDSDGVKINGVLQPAIETLRASQSFQNVSLTTTFATLAQSTLTIPSFATVVDVLAVGRLQVANTSGGTQSFEAQTQVASEPTDTARSYSDNNLTNSVMSTRADRITGSPSTVTVTLRGRVTSGSNSSNVGRLNVMATARRVA